MLRLNIFLMPILYRKCMKCCHKMFTQRVWSISLIRGFSGNQICSHPVISIPQIRNYFYDLERCTRWQQMGASVLVFSSSTHNVLIPHLKSLICSNLNLKLDMLHLVITEPIKEPSHQSMYLLGWCTAHILTFDYKFNLHPILHYNVSLLSFWLQKTVNKGCKKKFYKHFQA